MSAQTADTGPYADDTPLTHVFGGSARVKILAALLSERDHDLNVSDIARLAGVARSTVYEHIGELEDLHLVVHTRDIGGGPMYQLNNDSPIAERIRQIEGLALERLLEDEL